MSRREWQYAIIVCVLSAIAAIAFAIWTVYFVPRMHINWDTAPKTPWPTELKGDTIDDDNYRP